MNKNLILIIFTSLIVILYSKMLKTRTNCVALGKDCDLTAWCCGKSVCKDYRCRAEGTKENQENWANSKKNPGKKCDWFHHCPKNYTCASHRCVFSEKFLKSLNSTLTSF
jgi:hypothetical protein